MKRLLFIIITLLGASLLGSGAHATVTVAASLQGWFTQNGLDNSAQGANNFIVGNCGLDDCQNGEYRDFFEFFIPNMPGQTIASAQLRINAGQVELFQSPSLTVNFSSLSDPGFSNIGAGITYGTFTYTIANAYAVLSVELNAEAISAIAGHEGSLFLIGGNAISPIIFGPSAPDQFVFGDTGGLPPYPCSRSRP